MAYNDIVKRKTYEEFLKDAKTPYRGTKNEYPLGRRDYSHRKYIVHDGYIEIKLYSNVLGKLHKDWTFEFIAPNGYGGDAHMMFNRLFPCFYTCLRDHRDMAYVMDKTHVIFNGLRVHLDTGEVHHSSKYHLAVSVIDRAKTKAVRDSVKEEITLMRTYFMNSSTDELVNMLKQYRGESVRLNTINDPLEKMCAFMAAKDIRQLSSSANWRQWAVEKQLDSPSLRDFTFKAFKEAYYKHLYKERNAYRQILVQSGQGIPSNEQDVDLIKEST